MNNEEMDNVTLLKGSFNNQRPNDGLSNNDFENSRCNNDIYTNNGEIFDDKLNIKTEQIEGTHSDINSGKEYSDVTMTTIKLEPNYEEDSDGSNEAPKIEEVFIKEENNDFVTNDYLDTTHPNQLNKVCFCHNCIMKTNPPKKTVGKERVRKKEMITVTVKKEIIEKHEQGMRVADIARFYKKSTSTICTVLKKKNEIREIDSAKGVTIVTKHRTPILEDVEKLLLVWINEKHLAGDSVSRSLICEKARALYVDIVSKLPCTSREQEDCFKASRGWFDKFKRRSGIYSVVRYGEAASSDAKEAEVYAGEFQKLVATECYLPQQVFNCDETGLFWKKLPKRTYITIEEKTMPGLKPMEDRLTLLLCANASGDFKVKPLLVYHSENPQAFKTYKVQKSQLNVMWRSNSKAWITRILFVEWINEVFGPAVKTYLLENNLPLQVLLVMDKAPAHPLNLQENILEEFKFIKTKFIPSLLQPMDQQIITNFKNLYTKSLFQRCFEMTEKTNLNLRDFWKKHFNIVSCLKIIDKSWSEVTKTTLNSAWIKLWPDCVDGLAHEWEPPIVDEIVSLGKKMGLEVNKDDIQELVDEHGQELTTEELMALHLEQQYEEISSANEDKTEKSVTSNEIKEICNMWETVQHFVEKHHPRKAVAVRATKLFNDNAMSHFHQILKKRQKNVAIDRLPVKIPRKKKNVIQPLMMDN